MYIYLCVYIRFCVYMSVYVYIYTCVYIYVSVCLCVLYMCVYLYIRVCVYICTYLCVCIYVRLCVLYIRVCVYMYMFVCVCICQSVCVLYIRVCIYVHVCVCCSKFLLQFWGECSDGFSLFCQSWKTFVAKNKPPKTSPSASQLPFSFSSSFIPTWFTFLTRLTFFLVLIPPLPHLPPFPIIAPLVFLFFSGGGPEEKVAGLYGNRTIVIWVSRTENMSHVSGLSLNRNVFSINDKNYDINQKFY